MFNTQDTAYLVPVQRTGQDATIVVLSGYPNCQEGAGNIGREPLQGQNRRPRLCLLIPSGPRAECISIMYKFVKIIKLQSPDANTSNGLNKRCMHSRTLCTGPCGHSYRSPVPNGLPRRAGSKVPALEEIGTASPISKLLTTPNIHNHGDVMRSTRIREREK